MGAVRSLFPAASSATPERAKTLKREALTTLRAGRVPKGLAPLRSTAREKGAVALERARVTHGLSHGDVAASLGSDSEVLGARACAGSIPLTLGECVLRLPLPMALDAVAELLVERVAHERPLDVDGSRGALIRLHTDALRALLSYR